eukprot:1145957-Amphidinium_carterae.1
MFLTGDVVASSPVHAQGLACSCLPASHLQVRVLLAAPPPDSLMCLNPIRLMCLTQPPGADHRSHRGWPIKTHSQVVK